MDIDEFFEKVVKNKIKYFNEMKTKEDHENTIFIKMFIFMIITICLIPIVETIFIIPEGFLTILILIELFVPFIYLFSHNKRNHILYFKKEILTPFFNYCFNNVKYEFDNPISKIELNKISKYLFLDFKLKSNDSITLQINEKKIQMSNIHYNYRYGYNRRGSKIATRNALVIRIPTNNSNINASVVYNQYKNDNYMKVKKLKNILAKRVNKNYKVYISQQCIDFNEKYTLYISDDTNEDNIEKFINEFYNLAQKYKANDIGLCVVDDYINVFISEKTLEDFYRRDKDVMMNYINGFLDINLTNAKVANCEKKNFNNIYNKINKIETIIGQVINIVKYIQ